MFMKNETKQNTRQQMNADCNYTSMFNFGNGMNLNK